MNYKYEQKPVVIEAFQMTVERRWDNSEWPRWLHEAWNKDGVGAMFCVAGGDALFIETLEGTMAVNYEDWIICGIEGEIHPCKPSVFGATYEKV